jgi:hypothetical protein
MKLATDDLFVFIKWQCKNVWGYPPPHYIHVLDRDCLLYNPVLNASFYPNCIWITFWCWWSKVSLFVWASPCIGYHSCFIYVRPQFWVSHMSWSIDWGVSWVYWVFLDKCCVSVRTDSRFSFNLLRREYWKKTRTDVEKGHEHVVHICPFTQSYLFNPCS